MALAQSFTYELSSDAHTLVMTDTTGAYNATTNPGGYGGVNPAVGDFSAMTVTILRPDPETLLPTNSVTIDVYPTLPSSSSGTFDLTALLIEGADGVLPDGWYELTVSSTYDVGAETTVEVVNNKLIFDTAECCIDNLIVSAEGDCGCEGADEKNAKLALSVVYLYALNKRINDAEEIIESIIDECGDYTRGVEMIKYLQDVCDNDGCGGCAGC